MKGLLPFLSLSVGAALLLTILVLDDAGTMVRHRFNPMIFHFGIFLVSLGAVLVLGSFFKDWRDKVWLLFGSSWLCLVMLELSLRSTGIMVTYADQRTGRYFSPYEKNRTDDQRRWPASSDHQLETPEYRYGRKTNRLGFSDEEFMPKQSWQTLIQTYGDSYTEGDGAPGDSSYPALLWSIFNDTSIILQNYGVCGSDPGFSYRQILRSGLAFSPDVVVVGYNAGDYQTDFFTRGGLSRFHDDRWSSRAAPWWEFGYAYSHVFRGLCQLVLNVPPTGLLTTASERERRLSLMPSEWQEVFDSIANLSRNNGFGLLLVRHPVKFELEQRSYGQDFSAFERWLALHHPEVAHIDLMPYYLDSSGSESDAFDRLYWPIDGHHNSEGYLLMARAVHSAVISSFPDLFHENEASKGDGQSE